MSKALIRSFQLDDYDALITLWEASGLSYRPKGRDTKENIARELQLPMAVFKVAEIDGQIVGSVFGTHDGRKGWINRVAVHPDQRLRGVARELVRAVEDELEQQGIDIIACLIEDWNQDSMRFFEQIGYESMPDVTYYSKRKNWDV